MSRKRDSYLRNAVKYHLNYPILEAGMFSRKGSEGIGTIEKKGMMVSLQCYDILEDGLTTKIIRDCTN